METSHCFKHVCKHANLKYKMTDMMTHDESAGCNYQKNKKTTDLYSIIGLFLMNHFAAESGQYDVHFRYSRLSLTLILIAQTTCLCQTVLCSLFYLNL